MHNTALWIFLGTLGGMLLGAGALHLIPLLGTPGRRWSDHLCRAPALDIVMTYFTVAPMIAGAAIAGWLGLVVAIAAQFLALVVWTQVHEALHPAARKGPRIVKVLNRKVGRFRNHAALWSMIPAVPIFWLIRIGEILLYPPLVWLVGLPRYKSGEWVNLSRQKFEGLVGHDLVWCLYCDWMTGLWSFGSEMLRNLESFWCPIRFAHGKKCKNCSVDFPDIENGWIALDGNMTQVADLLDRTLVEGQHGWYGHPARLTVDGKTLS